MRSRRSRTGGGWLPESLLPASFSAVSVAANRPCLAVVGVAVATSSLARAAPTRIPAIMNICSSGIFFAIPLSNLILRSGFIFKVSYSQLSRLPAVCVQLTGETSFWPCLLQDPLVHGETCELPHHVRTYIVYRAWHRRQGRRPSILICS